MSEEFKNVLGLDIRFGRCVDFADEDRDALKDFLANLLWEKYRISWRSILYRTRLPADEIKQ